MIIAPSSQDASFYRRSAHSNRIAIVPNAIDLTRYSHLKRNPLMGSVLFVGSLDYFPNRNGLRWFLAKVWPRVTAQMASAHLYVVGENTSPEAFPPSDRVTFTGGVDSLDPYLECAAVSVCPLLQGGGTRLKIIEALVAGIPIVATSKGAEGLDVSTGRDLLIADDPASFAEGVLSVLGNRDLAVSLTSNGQQTATERYTWEAVARAIHDLVFEHVDGIAHSSRPRSRQPYKRDGLWRAIKVSEK